jgi:hypothetical protein
MHRESGARACALAIALSAGLTLACSRGEEPQAPVAQTQQQAQTETNLPVTLTGCLRAGESADTFVVTTRGTGAQDDAKTYQLVGREGVDFRSHVGRQVEVQGVVTSAQQIAAQTPPAPAGDRATGTTGTPTVQTTTEVEIQRLEVRQLRPVEGECAGANQ